MPKLIERNELKELLKETLVVSQDRFSEEGGYSEQSLKDVLRGKSKLTMEKQQDFIDTASIISKSNNVQSLKLDEMKIRKDLFEWAYDIIIKWADTEDIGTLITYWENFEDTYKEINEEKTEFLYRCIEITESADREDNRLELLDYMKKFTTSISSIHNVLPLINIFLNAEEKIKKRIEKYDFDNLNNNQEKASKFREKFKKQYKKLFFEIEEEATARIISRQVGFITTMDKMDWDLLIAYTMIRADDEDNKKHDMIWDKLEQLIAGDRG